MLVRRERPDDHDAVDALQHAAFARADHEVPVEVGLLRSLRVGPWFLPAFSLVATTAEGEPIGHVIATRGRVGDHPALGVGPLGVSPARQRGGVGSALMHSLLGAAEATGEAVVALLGDPGYYRRFGFVPAADLGIVAPDPEWGGFFQARRLAGPPVTGPFRYATPFDEL